MSTAIRDRLTAAEWRQMNGLPPAGADVERPLLDRLSASSNPPVQPDHLRPQRGKMNKTGAAYAQHLHALQLAGKVKGWRFESITLRLADATRYTPDFLVELFIGPIELHEVKGFWRDDARVKFKVAAELFPMFQFVAVKRKKRAWDVSYASRSPIALLI